jgi:hypothetical protein
MNAINTNKGAGPDGIHPIFIKNCSANLAFPLTIIFQKSIKSGCVPEIWKKAFVTPIPKGQVSQNIEQFRPISKLCQFNKIFEKIVTSQLYQAVKNHISPNQHGFYKGRSVDTNLLTFAGDILLAMDKGACVEAVYTDFAKAFDKICHSTLLFKLWHLGIHGDLFRWIKSYIENRSQCVVLSGYASHWKSISSGVPQGSHLGPLLFTLFINDIDKYIKNSKVLLYADDTKIYKIINSIDDYHLLQDDLVNFETFCSDNNLFLNLNKCFAINFSKKKHTVNYNFNLCNNQLSRVTEIRDLGVIMDSKLSFTPHLDSVIKKGYKQLGFILRLGKPFKNSVTYKILFNSFVRSHLEFACAVWKPYHNIHIDRVERIQKKFIRTLDFRTGHTHTNYTESLTHHKLQTLSDRRNCVDSVLLYKIMRNILDVPSLLHQINLRVPPRHQRLCQKKKLFSIPYSRTCYAKNVFIRRTCKYFNEDEKLDNIDLFNCSIFALKYAFQ